MDNVRNFRWEKRINSACGKMQTSKSSYKVNPFRSYVTPRPTV
jgi:hypothetical protein